MILRGRLLLARGQDAASIVGRAQSMLGDRLDRRFERRLRVLELRTLEPAAALALAESELGREAAHGNYAAMIPLWTLAARFALQLGRAVAAQRHSVAALEALSIVRPLDFSAFAVRFVHAQVEAAIEPARGAPLLAALARELTDHAERFVPHEHRAGFLRGVLLNRAILDAGQGRPLVRMLR